ncbi:hypothetical protein [Prosthecochloris vibrioformis]|uniref:hypothetical protein n=1 Tax=Prosthecochloris vibrioformis TaxID=1098 RepID=UPI001117C3FB|nr:hypothetical protein [Prosthecochloris vibrioformis]
MPLSYNVGFFGILAALIASMGQAFTIQPAFKDTLILLLGVMASELKNVNAFWVGLSYGSKQKADTLAQAMAEIGRR